MAEPFPPEPWHLRGDMFVGVWLVPRRELPGWPLPPGVRPVGPGRRCVLVTFWVDYRPGSTLAYRELLVALAVRDGRGQAACAVEVWVDDERSLAGGRALWGIPKQRGDFAFGGTALTSRTRMSVVQGEPVEGAAGPPVTGLHRDLLPLPGRLPVRSRLVQPHPVHGVCEVPMRLSGRVRLGRARLVAEPGGPLDYLAGRKVLLAASVRDFRMTVGSGEGRPR
ncbi:acetoacetate decarboxylase family protein [Streptomyces sp. NPDC000070]|uniref:acetoacetate decarboxylase family protein n=1 Tax=Streptomyces sp. NPDC000070 TaxID=3154240 RepID=UPI00331BEBB7